MLTAISELNPGAGDEVLDRARDEHLARLEAQVALERLLARLPGVQLDLERPSASRGLVFRKPPTLWVSWDASGTLST